MNASQSIDRTPLRFAEQVRGRFGFLEAYGFICTRSESTLVQFIGRVISIDVYHGRQSYEIGLEVGSAADSGTRYSMFEILRLYEGSQAEHYRNYASHTLEGIAEGVRQLADRFRRCVGAGLLVDPALLDRLKAQRADLAKAYGIATQVGQASVKADAAWAKKDFEGVVRELSPFRSHLSAVYRRKLEYAEKQVCR